MRRWYNTRHNPEIHLSKTKFIAWCHKKAVDVLRHNVNSNDFCVLRLKHRSQITIHSCLTSILKLDYELKSYWGFVPDGQVTKDAIPFGNSAYLLFSNCLKGTHFRVNDAINFRVSEEFSQTKCHHIFTHMQHNLISISTHQRKFWWVEPTKVIE